MKSLSTIKRLLFATAVLGAGASFAYAGPGPQYGESLTRKAQFDPLKAGEKVALYLHRLQNGRGAFRQIARARDGTLQGR